MLVSSLVSSLLATHGVTVYVIVGLLVFAEDALFVGFVLPGETAAILGGVAASHGNASLPIVIAVVVAAAILGDSVGFEIGRVLGPRLLRVRPLRRHEVQLGKAIDLLARRGGTAVFLGRFTAFFRATMPALAGAARMPYPRFLAFNAAGGIVWGVAVVLLGFAAGDSYHRVETLLGRSAAIVAALAVAAGLVLWHFRRRRRSREAVAESSSASQDAASARNVSGM